MEIILPHHWTKFCRKPYCAEELTSKLYIPNFANFPTIYGFLFFDKKRTIIINRNWDKIGSMDTRNSKFLVNEAIDSDWIKEIREKYKLPWNEPFYPDIIEKVILIEVSNNLSGNKNNVGPSGNGMV